MLLSWGSSPWRCSGAVGLWPFWNEIANAPAESLYMTLLLSNWQVASRFGVHSFSSSVAAALGHTLSPDSSMLPIFS